MQLTMAFQPGLTQEFKTLRQVTQAAVVRTRGGIAGVAPAVDMSPSLLGRKLQGNPDDPHRTLDVDDFEQVLAALVKAGDFSPIFYLLERFNLSREQQQSVAVARISALLPELVRLVADAQQAPPPAAKGRAR